MFSVIMHLRGEGRFCSFPVERGNIVVLITDLSLTFYCYNSFENEQSEDAGAI